MAPRFGVWAGRQYFLDKMTLRDLVRAYFTYYAILAYLALAAITIVLTFAWSASPWPPLLAAALVVPVYPLVWYLLHRFVLHGKYLYKWSHTAAVWKRIHYDHHRDPNDLSVLFGALYTTLPTIALVTLPIGYFIGGPDNGLGSAMAALASGLVVTCIYEFCHCCQHLPFAPKNAWLRRIKKLHLAHHFHNEQGNFGITSFWCDQVLGTYYAHPKQVARSETVFNLGYTDQVAERYPWVARLDRPADLRQSEA